ncbi:MAG: hypothetical protein RSH79_06705, partial [Clostridiales bacterium]
AKKKEVKVGLQSDTEIQIVEGLGENEAIILNTTDLKDGDKVLISEGCTHHRQCEDIGTVKLPKWVNDYTGKKLIYKYTGGVEFPLDLTPYKIIIHCGGCTLNEREMQYRIECAGDSNVPITNYGIAISYMRGILERSLKVFSEI